MRFLIVISSILILGLSACTKKEFPEPISSEPVFRAEIVVDGSTFNLTPGVNGNYMYTEQQELGAGNVILESGIAPENCQDCGPALWFTWNSNTPSGLSEPYDPALHFLNGSYSFDEGPEVGTPMLQIENFNDLTANGGQFTLGGNPVNSELIEFNGNPGEFIDLHYVANGIDPGILEASLFVGNVIAPSPCDLNSPVISGFTIDVADPQTAIAFAPDFLPPNAPVVWEINDEDPMVILASEPAFFSIEEPIMSITASVQGEFGEVFWLYNVSILPIGPGLIEPLGFNVSSTPLPEVGDPDVSIRYVNEEGETFRSFLCNGISSQPPGSFFDVVAQDTYTYNSNGTLTSVVTISTQVALFSDSNPLAEPLILSVDQADIAFALGE